MGNRAVITFSTATTAPAIYLHWNGGRASIEGFLAAAQETRLAGRSKAELRDALAKLIAGALGVEVDRSTVYRTVYAAADRDNNDNGVYVIDESTWTIVKRIYAPRAEEVDPEKSEAVRVAALEAWSRANAQQGA